MHTNWDRTVIYGAGVVDETACTARKIRCCLPFSKPFGRRAQFPSYAQNLKNGEHHLLNLITPRVTAILAVNSSNNLCAFFSYRETNFK